MRAKYISLMIFLSAAAVLAGLAGGSALLCFQPAPAIKVSVDRSSVDIGETFKCSLRAWVPPGADMKVPSSADIFKKLSVKGEEEEKRFFPGGFRRIDKVFFVTSYVPGEYEIPAVSARVKLKNGKESTVSSAGNIKITVKTLLEKDFSDRPARVKFVSGGPVAGGYSETEPEGTVTVREKKGPIRFRIRDEIGLRRAVSLKERIAAPAIAVLAVSILALLFFIIKKVSRRKPRIVDPAPMAEKKIEDLKNGGLSAPGRLKEYSFAVYSIMADYVKTAYGLPPVEMTTEKFLEAIDGIGRLSPGDKRYLCEFFRACDTVKYSSVSDGGAAPPAIEVSYALEFIKTTSAGAPSGTVS
jgi:hypothetical protein